MAENQYSERANAWYRFQQANARATGVTVSQLFDEAVDPADLYSTWRQVTPRATRLAIEGAVRAGNQAGRYVGLSVSESVEVAVNGRSLVSAESVASQMEYAAKNALFKISRGVPQAQAYAEARTAVGRAAANAARDAGKNGVSIAMQDDTRVGGWIRRLQQPSCGRCTILAGRKYTKSAGFDRHPNCDCVHSPLSKPDYADFEIPAEAAPTQVFNSLSEANQNKYFGKAQADAIRDGRSVISAVNQQRAGLSSYGPTASKEVRERLGTASELRTPFPTGYSASNSGSIASRNSLFARAEARRQAR